MRGTRRGRSRRVAVAAVAFALCSSGTMLAATRSASAKTVSSGLRQTIARLPVANENRAGYDRSKFHLWIDANHNGCDTRKEVLIAEAVTKPHKGAHCALTGGRWHSVYDNVYTSDASTFDIDHVVPLAEAWDSG